jgi:long-chain acyl-CoA synthetase
MPLTDLLTRQGAIEAPALIFQGVPFSRREIRDAVKDLAGRLKQAGVSRGSKVVLSLPNDPAWLWSFLAVNECRAVVLPIHPALAREERARIDEIAAPDFVIAHDGDVEILPGVCLSRHRLAHRDDAVTDLAAIVFTSGTTGAPKGVMLTEAALMANAGSVARYLELSHRDRMLVFLPLCYAYALSQVLSTLSAGGCVVLLADLRFPKQVFDAIGEHRVTGFGGVPTSFMILTRYPHDASAAQDSLRCVLSAGGPLAPSLVERIRHAFPNAAIFNNYGCTEIGPRATTVNYKAHPDRIGSIGRAIDGVSLTLVGSDRSPAGVGETGEIVLSGPSLMKGYYRDPQTTAARMSSLGFHTGDYAYADADGFLYYQGRKDDVFKSAGEKISAREVEDVVLEHEDVVEAAVISSPDAVFGAVPVVYAVLREGTSCTDRELQAFCARRLSRHKVPRAVHFVEELRKTATGKIQKHLLGHHASDNRSRR